MAKRSPAEANGLIQATIVKKCSRAFHRPESNKGCASGTCQHTCDPAQVETCVHKWTVRYSVNSRQREASFATLTEAQVFQAELSTKKVTQGALFVDPRAGVIRFGEMRRQYTARLDVSAGSLRGYECDYRGSGAARMLDDLPVGVVARMDAEVEELLNVTRSLRSRRRPSPQGKERYARSPKRRATITAPASAPPRECPRCPKPGHRGHYAIHQEKPPQPPGHRAHAPASTRKPPHSGGHGDPGTARPAQPPKTRVELGPGGCLLSVPKRKTPYPLREHGVLPSYSTIQQPPYCKKVKVVEKQKSKPRSKPCDGTDDSRMCGLKKIPVVTTPANRER
jgi:hypothetical protein